MFVHTINPQCEAHVTLPGGPGDMIGTIGRKSIDN